MKRLVSVVLLLVACGDDTGVGGSAGSTTGASGSQITTSSVTTAGTASGNTASGSGSSGAGSTGSGSMAALPADVIDLSKWKLTLPTGAPDEILQPELSTFAVDPWFVLNAARDGVLFRANAGGATTSNSGYPRSELREMDGSEGAAWSLTSGKHTMTIRQAITHLPEVKPHVVAGQIHDDEDDVVMIRLEGENLFVEGGGEDLGTLDPAYVLGTVFTVSIVAEDGTIRISYDGGAPVEVARTGDGMYFKAGCYTQSNPERGDEPDAYGEVVIHELTVVHE